MGLADSEGATAVEYGIMVALIAIVIIGAVIVLGRNLEGVFGEVACEVGEVVDGDCPDDGDSTTE